MKTSFFKILLMSGTLLFLTHGGYRMYTSYLNGGTTKESDTIRLRSFFKMAKRWEGHPGNRHIVSGNEAMYSYQRMLTLIEACQKVKYLEHLRFVSPDKVKPVETQTIRDLTKVMIQEKFKFKNYVSQVKGHSKEPLSTKKMRSFLYYLRVLEEGVQDLDIILTNRMINNTL